MSAEFRGGLRVAAFIIAATAFCFHFLMTCIYLVPLNPIKLDLMVPVQSYMNTFFQQNWHLFAPSPISVNESLLGKCRTSNRESSWFDVTAATLASLHANRLSPLGAHAGLQMRAIRMYKSGFSSLMDRRIVGRCLGMPDGGIDDSDAADDVVFPDYCRALHEERESTRKRALVMLERLVTDACRAQRWPDVEHINIRIATLVFPRFSRRHEPDAAGSVTFEETGWRAASDAGNL